MARKTAPESGATCECDRLGPATERRERFRRPDARGRRKERATLDPACTVGHGVDQKRLRQRIELLEILETLIAGIEERQRREPGLLDRSVQELPQRVVAVELAMLPGGLESPRVRERTGRKRRIHDLPGQPIRHRVRTENTAAQAAARGRVAHAALPRQQSRRRFPRPHE